VSQLLGVSRILRGVALCESQNHPRNGRYPSVSEPLFLGFPCMKWSICICRRNIFWYRITLEKPRLKVVMVVMFTWHARLCDSPMNRSILPRFLNSTPDVLECDSWHVRALQCLGKVIFIGIWTGGGHPLVWKTWYRYTVMYVNLFDTHIYFVGNQECPFFTGSVPKRFWVPISLSLYLYTFIYTYIYIYYIYLRIHIRIHIKIHL